MYSLHSEGFSRRLLSSQLSTPFFELRHLYVPASNFLNTVFPLLRHCVLAIRVVKDVLTWDGNNLIETYYPSSAE